MNVEPINTFEKIGDAAKRVVEKVRPPMLDFFEVYEDRIMPEPMSGCFIWTGSLTTAGYGNFTRYSQTFYAHRCAYEAANNVVPEDGLVVRHKCDFKCCCNPDHLEIGTHKDNVDDAWRRGRMNPARGEDCGCVTLNEEVVIAARDLAARRIPVSEIARRLGVSWKSIDYAIRGATWRHLPGAMEPLAKAKTSPPHHRGEKAANAKLTEENVRQIRQALTEGETGRALARKFGVSPATISSIKVGRNWA